MICTCTCCSFGSPYGVYEIFHYAGNINLRDLNERINSFKETSRLVWEGGEELRFLAERNKLILYWEPEHLGITGNEEADEGARHVSSTPQFGHEPAIGYQINFYESDNATGH